MSVTTQVPPHAALPVFKSKIVLFMLWEGFKFCNNHLREIKTLVEEVSEKEYPLFIKHISDMRRHFQLMNFPIIASVFLKEDDRYNIFDSLIGKAEHVLSASYYLPKLFAADYIDHETYQEAMEILATKASIIPATNWFDTALYDDNNYVEKIITDINQKTMDSLYSIRNNYYHGNLKDWQKNSPFSGKSPNDILNELRGYTIQQLLITANMAMASGVDKEDIEILIVSAIQAGGTILPIKFFMCAYENMQLCKCDIASKRSSYIEDGEMNKISVLKSSQYSLDDFLTQQLLDKINSSGTIPDHIVCCVDESGSQQQHMMKSVLPITKWQFNAMMIFELIHSTKNVSIVFTGVPMEMRKIPQTVEHLKSLSMIELYFTLTNEASFRSGIYVGRTLDWLAKNKTEFSFDDKTVILILADDEDGLPMEVYPHKSVKFDKNKTIFINVDRSGNYETTSNPQFILNIKGYSDYWIEPIKMVLGINSGAAKNMDSRGYSFRGEE